MLEALILVFEFFAFTLLLFEVRRAMKPGMPKLLGLFAYRETLSKPVGKSGIQGGKSPHA